MYTKKNYSRYLVLKHKNNQKLNKYKFLNVKIKQIPINISD